jgi:hypothetical protein
MKIFEADTQVEDLEILSDVDITPLGDDDDLFDTRGTDLTEEDPQV